MKYRFLFRFLLAGTFGLFSFLSYGQSIKSYDKVEIQTLYLNSKDSVVRFQVLTDSKKVKYLPVLTYWWYKSNAILKTTGGADGKLLGGEYVSFYPDNNLKEKGHFLKGVKDELWITWFPDGKIQEQVSWKKGVMHGERIVFDKDGNKLTSEKYRKGKLLKPKNKPEKKVKGTEHIGKTGETKDSGKKKQEPAGKPLQKTKINNASPLKKGEPAKKRDNGKPKPVEKGKPSVKSKQKAVGK